METDVAEFSMDGKQGWNVDGLSIMWFARKGIHCGLDSAVIEIDSCRSGDSKQVETILSVTLMS